MSSSDPANVVVLICGPDGLCSLCAGEDRTGTDGCGAYFRAARQPVLTMKEKAMPEPEDKTLVLIGNLTDNDPWHLELWARDDTNAEDSTAHWYRAGLGEDAHVQRVSWDWLEQHAAGRMDTLKVLGSGLA